METEIEETLEDQGPEFGREVQLVHCRGHCCDGGEENK